MDDKDKKTDLENKVKDAKPKFDPDLQWYNIQNKNAAKAYKLRYDRRLKMYVDEDGALVRDRYGQRL